MEFLAPLAPASLGFRWAVEFRYLMFSFRSVHSMSSYFILVTGLQAA